jgi:hypothetical protein
MNYATVVAAAVSAAAVVVASKIFKTPSVFSKLIIS